MEDKKVEIEGLKPFRMMCSSSSSPSMLKPFVDGGIAGLLSCSLRGAIDYSMSTITTRVSKTILTMWVIASNMIPGLVLVDAFAFSQILGFYNIGRGIAVARNDGAWPSLYQEAANGLIAGVATAYLRFPFDVISQQRQVESMGPIAQRWSIRNLSALQILRVGGPLLKRNAGLGASMVAAYNPSVRYLTETHGLTDEDARYGAAISAFSAAAWAQLGHHATSFNYVRQTLKSKGPLALFEGFSILFFRTYPAVVLFWGFSDVVHRNFHPPTEA